MFNENRGCYRDLTVAILGYVLQTKVQNADEMCGCACDSWEGQSSEEAAVRVTGLYWMFQG